MVKFGVKLLFVTGTHIIITAICDQYFTELSNSIIIKTTILLELLISCCVIYLGYTGMNKNSKEK